MIVALQLYKIVNFIQLQRKFMNSSEQKGFENIRPSDDEIEVTIQLINDILDSSQIDLLKNKSVKEGYDEAVDILVEDKRSYGQISTTLKSVQGRAIAVLAVDYLNGECTREILVGVPIKK